MSRITTRRRVTVATASALALLAAGSDTGAAARCREVRGSYHE